MKNLPSVLKEAIISHLLDKSLTYPLISFACCAGLFLPISLLSQPCTQMPPNLIINPSFEILACPPPAQLLNGGINSQCAANWQAGNGTPSICAVPAPFPGNGQVYACIGAADNNGNCVRNEAIFQNINICQNIPYNLTFDLIGINGTGILQVFLASGLTNIPLPLGEGGSPCLVIQPNWQLLATIPVTNTQAWAQNPAIPINSNNPALNQLLFVLIPNNNNQFSLGIDNIQMVSTAVSQLVPVITTQYNCVTRTANFLGTIANPIQGLNVTTWFWDFGDGTTGNGQNVTHTYSTTGNYTVCLTVTDNCGSLNTITQVVSVPNYILNIQTSPLYVCRNGIGQVRIPISLQDGSGNGSLTLPVTLQASVPTSLTIIGVEFNSAGLATIDAPLDGTIAIADLVVNIPSTFQVNDVINIQIQASVCDVTNNYTIQLVVQDCGEFTCPCSGPNAYNIVGGKLSDSVLPPGQVSNACLAVKGIFTLDENYLIQGGEIRMQPGSTLNIQRSISSGTPITVNLDDITVNGGIHGCGAMWIGIGTSSGETLNFTDNIISDANYGIFPSNNATINVLNNLFDNNKRGLFVNGSSGLTNTPNASIAYNTFTASNPTLLDGTKAESGIHVNYGTLFIGTYDNQTGPWNEFYRLNRCVYSHNSMVGIGGAIMYDFPVQSPAFGVDAAKSFVGITYSSITGATNGIKFDGLALVAYSNIIQSCRNQGIKADNVGWSTSVERNNQFINNHYGGVHHGGPGLLRITGSNLFQFNIPQTQSPGIEAGFSNGFYNEIRGNTFNYTGAGSGNTHLIYLLNSKNFRVYDNLIAPSNNETGIWLQNVDKSLFKNNTVFQNSPSTPSVIGIFSRFCDGNKFCCNNFRGVSIGFNFYGPSGQSDIRHSDIDATGVGIYCFSGTVLGEQQHAGNLWNGFNAIHKGTKQQKNGSRFWIQDGDLTTPGIQKTPPYWPALPTDDEFMSYKLGMAASTCEGDPLCLPPIFPELGDGGEDESIIKGSDISTVRNLYSGEIYGDVLNWELQRELLIRMRTNNELIGLNSVTDSFYYANSSTNLSRFVNIEIGIDQLFIANPLLYATAAAIHDSISFELTEIKKIDSLLIITNEGSVKDSLRNVRKQSLQLLSFHYSEFVEINSQLKSVRQSLIGELILENSSIITSSQIEENLKLTNDIYLEVLKKEEYSLTENEALTILPIAEQCPLIGGKSVLRARGLYSLYDHKIFDDEVICGTEERDSGPTLLSKTPGLSLHPNPSNGQVYIVAPEQGAGKYPLQISVYDLSGIVVYNNSINFIGSNVINLFHLPNGLYQVKITLPDGSSRFTKLVLAKP